ncbi:flavodoxin family protein [Arthrobacter sp. CAN_C5]|uniref:flavodoxin family protein n=1 Tax=Arthrobacter sp. CAN_C5 TaxID=2760706 RepID=UPI001AE3212E|nr:NAD(P)H-dependent oxidoreductase [Arthrobacter sp. CAN_C5]MBP2217008.1 multimeric flavodoxin WrbA [Arthrobacter sp. CAN_C5]
MHAEAGVTVAVAYHSGYGHTERQAQAVAEGARQAVGSTAVLYNVAELSDELWEGLAEADAIIFGTPTYMGSQSSVFQAFAEASGSVWAAQGWKDKVAANALTSLSVLAAQHSMHWVSQGPVPQVLETPREPRTQQFLQRVLA